jgi:hypothetical protein
VLFCAVICVSLVLSGWPQARLSASSSFQNRSLSSIVAGLGSDDNDLERLKALALEPVEAARLLVSELHPVNGVRILSSEQEASKWRDTLHVVWCLRALRYLTGGMEFEAKTGHRFGNSEVERNRKWFIGDGAQYSKKETVRFFGVWMSRDSLYLAPRDAQVEIIRNWVRWYAQDGKRFHYADPKLQQPPDAWYF